MAISQSHATATASFRSSDFVQVVLGAIRTMYPEELADKSWDNTGLLLESVPQPNITKTVLLTNDLTTAAVDNAIKLGAAIIITYHPIIFSGLKSLTLANTQQASLLRLASAGIAVYSPHSSVDAVPGGLNDWLADVLLGGGVGEKQNPAARSTMAYRRTKPELESGERKWVRPIPVERLPESFRTGVNGHFGAGHGRIVRLREAGVSLAHLMSNVSGMISGTMDHDTLWGGTGNELLIALPAHISTAAAGESRSHSPTGGSTASATTSRLSSEDIATFYGSIVVRSFAVCVGSGWDILRDVPDVDLLVTGEMNHHAALAATERGQMVLATLHGNSERGFLSHRMQPVLQSLLEEKGYNADVDSAERHRVPPPRRASIFTHEQNDPFRFVATRGFA